MLGEVDAKSEAQLALCHVAELVAAQRRRREVRLEVEKWRRLVKVQVCRRTKLIQSVLTVE